VADSLRATNFAQTIWNERLMQDSSMNTVTMAAAWENKAGPSNRAITTLKIKLRADTRAEPKSRTRLPLSSREAGLFKRQSLHRVRNPPTRGNEIVSWSELIEYKGCCCLFSYLRAAALDVRFAWQEVWFRQPVAWEPLAADKPEPDASHWVGIPRSCAPPQLNCHKSRRDGPCE